MSKLQFRVLLIDDDEDEFIVIQDLLTDLNENSICLEWVPTFQKAKELIALRRHDAYLVDYRLGEKTGLDLIREVINENLTDAPFILLTGHGDHDTDIEAMETGVADYLVKHQLSAHLLERSVRYSVVRAQNVRELKEREEAVRSFFDAAFEGIIVHDREGKILDVNWTAAKILGGTPEGIIGTSLTRCFTPEAEAVLTASHETATPKTLKAIGIRMDGKSVDLEVSSKPYQHKGKQVILTSCRDISERVEMEAQILQQDRLASIGLLASSLAHEIGTPLGVIRGRAEYLEFQRDASTEVKRCASIIITQIDRVSRLIRSLLTLARGDGSRTVGPVDVHQVVGDVLDLLGHEFLKKQIHFCNKVEPGTKVLAEPGPLHQVLLNLLVNSIHAIESASKAGRSNDHQVRILADDLGLNWMISVSDTGCGISPTNLKQIFKPFFTTKEIGVGTGLGLATSYRIIEAWGGKIQVESQEGVGTLFKIILPKHGSVRVP